jgi:hypothetical protein
VCFEAWSEHVGEEVRKRGLMKRVASRLTGNSMANAWDRWCQRMDEGREAAAAAAAEVREDEWQALCSHLAFKEREVCELRAFGRWVDVVGQARLEEVKENQRETRLKKWMVSSAHACVSSCLQGWAQYVVSHGRTRDIMRKNKLRIEAGSVAKSFAKWVQHADASIRHRQDSQVQLQLPKF